MPESDSIINYGLSIKTFKKAILKVSDFRNPFTSSKKS